MKRSQLKEVLDGITNQLDKYDIKELLQKSLDIMTTKQKEEIFDYCKKIHSLETRVSLEENGIIKVD